MGFEPTVPCGTPDFESGTFGHSATSPVSERDCSSGLMCTYSLTREFYATVSVSGGQPLQGVADILGTHLSQGLQLARHVS